MLVNGVPYPMVPVDARRYRLRILNGCQARFLNLMLYEAAADGVTPDFNKPGPNFLVIGTEGGFLAFPTIVPTALLQAVDDGFGNRSVDPAKPGGALITAPAERWDVVVNFNGKSGKKYILCNDAPAPYPSGDALNDYPRDGAPNGNTQIIIRFDVKAAGASGQPTRRS